MSAKKALKKLKNKATKPQENTALKALKQLKNPQSDPSRDVRRSLFSDELKTVANQAVFHVVQELTMPLNPIRSWFNDTGGVVDFTSARTGAVSGLSRQPANDSHNPASLKSMGHLPLKSPPCKRCPALASGICKCAAKKFSL